MLFLVTVSSHLHHGLVIGLIGPSVTTAIFSTCGMSIFVFSLAAILSMPKHFITVFIGVMIEQAGTGEEFSSVVHAETSKT